MLTWTLMKPAVLSWVTHSGWAMRRQHICPQRGSSKESSVPPVEAVPLAPTIPRFNAYVLQGIQVVLPGLLLYRTLLIPKVFFCSITFTFELPMSSRVPEIEYKLNRPNWLQCLVACQLLKQCWHGFAFCEKRELVNSITTYVYIG